METKDTPQLCRNTQQGYKTEIRNKDTQQEGKKEQVEREQVRIKCVIVDCMQNKAYIN
jgi:hypothetical protein